METICYLSWTVIIEKSILPSSTTEIDKVQRLIEVFKKFREGEYPDRIPLFQGLAAKHEPDTLFITCFNSWGVPEAQTTDIPFASCAHRS